MQLKGKATIQIFDDKNNLKRELIEENLITKAVPSIATLEGKEFIQGLRSTSINTLYYHLPNITPLATELFGGILLFEDAQEEDVNNIFPSASAKPVGHAGAPYSGANPYRGTYNQSESGVLYSGTNPIGYRHVWDFATDRCNGKIGSICLTSKAGGNTGWKSRGLASDSRNESFFDQDSTLSTYLCAGTSLANKTFSGSLFGKSAAIVPTMTPLGSYNSRILYLDEETGDFYFITSSGVVTKGSFPPSITLGLDTTVYPLRNPNAFTDLFTINNSLGQRTFIVFDKEAQRFTTIVATGSTTLEKRVYSLEGLISTDTINLSGATLQSWNGPGVPPFFYKDKVYALITVDNAVQIGEFDSSGALLQTFPWGAMSGTTMIASYLPDLDRVSLRSRYISAAGVEVLFNGSSFEAFRHADTNNSEDAFLVDCSNKNYPGFYVSLNRYDGGFYTSELNFCFRTNYLGSINNIDNPIIKTTADTMKITYDIYTA